MHHIIPCLTHQGMKVVRCIKGSQPAKAKAQGGADTAADLSVVAAKLQAALKELLQPVGGGEHSSLSRQQPSSSSAPLPSSSGATSAASDPKNASSSSASSSSVWDPPLGKLAKPGAMRSFPGKGRGVFW